MSDSAPLGADGAAPADKPTRMFTWRGAAALALGLVAMAVGVWFVVGPWGAIFVYVSFPTVVALVLLNERFPRIGRMAAGFAGGYWRFTFWLATALVPILGARLLSDVVAGASLPVGLAVLLVWVAIFLLLLLQVTTESRREKFWRRARRIDRVTPFLYTFSVAFVAIILFATLAFILSDRKVIEFAAGSAIDEPSDAADLFLWHLLDSIPALDITTTLRWEEPLGYTDGGVGVMLLAFKLVVIIPVVAAFVAFWRYNRDPGDAQEPGAIGEESAGT